MEPNATLNAEGKEGSKSPARNKPQREMFFPDTTNSKAFNNTYLSKQSNKMSSSPRKAKNKLTKNDSPAPPNDGKTLARDNSHDNSQSNISPTTGGGPGGYNITNVIAANTSQQSLGIKAAPSIPTMRAINNSALDAKKQR